LGDKTDVVIGRRVMTAKREDKPVVTLVRREEQTEPRLLPSWSKSAPPSCLSVATRRQTRACCVLRPVGGGPRKKRGLREGLWTLSTEQINATCRLVRGVD